MDKGILLVVLTTISFVGCTQPNLVPTSAHIDSCLVLSAQTNFRDGYYCVQDEYNTNSLKPTLDSIDNGVAISVGSIRALSLIALGKFDHALMIDYDEAIVEFNIILKNIIKALSLMENTTAREQRLNFISLLGGYWLDAKNLETSADPRLEVIHLLNSKLVEKNSDNTIKARYGIELPLENIHTALQQPYDDLLEFRSKLNGGFEGLRSLRIRDFIISIANYYGADISGNTMDAKLFFWESDEQWNRLVNLFKNDKIGILNGDLGNQPLLDSIKRCLEETNKNLAVVDVSSAFESLTFLSEDQISMLVEFINVSPKHQNSQLIFTSHNNQSAQPGLHHVTTGTAPKFWRYYSFDLSNTSSLKTFLADYQRYNP